MDGGSKAYEKLRAVLADLYKEHLYLMESDKLDAFSKEIFCQVASQQSEQGTMENSLLYLTRMMQAHYGKPVILLIDEYDVPLAKASDNGYHREMLDVMKGIMQVVKDNVYYDYREDFYHAFLAGICAGAGYVVESDREHGEGRSDIIVQDYSGDCVAIFEVKYVKSREDLAQSCEEAIAQIDDRMYGEEFQDDYSKVICYGVSFYL